MVRKYFGLHINIVGVVIVQISTRTNIYVLSRYRIVCRDLCTDLDLTLEMDGGDAGLH